MFDITKIRFNRGVTLSLIIISLIAPSTLLIYFFENALFIKLDFFKLLLLAISIGSVPLTYSFVIRTSLVSDGVYRKKEIKAQRLNNVLTINSFSIFIGLLIYPIAKIFLTDANYQSLIIISFGISFFFVYPLVAYVNKRVLKRWEY